MFFIAMFVGMFGVFFISFISIIIVLIKITRYVSTIFMSIIVGHFSVSVLIIAMLFAIPISVIGMSMTILIITMMAVYRSNGMTIMPTSRPRASPAVVHKQ